MSSDCKNLLAKLRKLFQILLFLSTFSNEHKNVDGKTVHITWKCLDVIFTDLKGKIFKV